VVGETGGAMLRLTGGTPFPQALNASVTINLYLHEAVAIFDAGFFVDHGADFANSITNANWNFYIRDDSGSVEWNGLNYQATAAIPWRTVASGRDFGDGPVSGRVLRFGSLPEGPAPVGSWLDANFTAEELADPQISGPQADPDQTGIPNLLRYALGLERTSTPEEISEALPSGEVEDVPVLRIRRLKGDPADTGVIYGIGVSTNLLGAAAWNTASLENDLEEKSVTDHGDGTETVEYEVKFNGSIGAKYFRQEIQLDEGN
jgi:hypothetical protein